MDRQLHADAGSETPPLYPVFLALAGRKAVVAGGGTVASRKISGLLECGARVLVIAPEVVPEIEALAAAGTVELRRRPFAPADMEGAFLAVAATDDPATNELVFREGEARGILVNAADDPAHSNFILPSLLRRGSLAIAVSTAGRSPALAVRIREELERRFGPEYATCLTILGGLRDQVAARFPDPDARKTFWYRLVDSDLLDAIRSGDEDAVTRSIERALEGA
ncbi:MAG: bifunctional precorrin-2 dehydrogenase/sirohydrochlorin ferrochelatase [Planctomycetes bacterium]|nr:bifunctional precorrin-2 dehydrogenase/sirohydrochlorin ferrochelatase [Planctomycetota bacterium]